MGDVPIASDGRPVEGLLDAHGYRHVFRRRGVVVLGLGHVRLQLDGVGAFLGAFLHQVMRSRNVSVSIILQNLSQLKALFEKQWESIVRKL